MIKNYLSLYKIKDIIKENSNSVILVSFIFLLLLPLYLFKLGSIPTNVHGDEGETALQAIKIINSNFALVGIGWFDLPLLSFVPHALFMFVFGENIVSDRLGSVVFGFFSLPLFYLLLKNIFDRKIALISVILLGTSHLWLALSRLGITYVQSTFFILIVSFALFKGLETSKKIYFLTSGALFGLSMYSNFAVRLLPILVLLFFVNYFLKKGLSKYTFFNFLLFSILSLIVFLPQAIFYLHNPQTFSSREKSIFVFSKEAKQWTGYSNMSNVAILLKQTERTFNIFAGDTSGQYGYREQLLDDFSIILFLIGVFYGLSKIKNFKYQFMFLWLSLSILGQIFSSIPPPIFLPRFVVGLPVLYFFISIGIVSLLNILKKTLKIKKTHEYSVIIFLLVIFSLCNIFIYFINYPKQIMGDPNARAATKISAILNNGFNTAYFYTQPYLYANFSTLEFLSPKVEKVNENPSNPKFYKQSRSIYIVYPEYENLIPLLSNQIPDGKLKEIRDIDGGIQFYTFTP